MKGRTREKKRLNVEVLGGGSKVLVGSYAGEKRMQHQMRRLALAVVTVWWLRQANEWIGRGN